MQRFIASVFVATLLVPAALGSGQGAQRSDGNLTDALFFTAEWCAPCRAVRPVLRRLEARFPNEFRVVVVDFDAARGRAEEWDVQEIPVVIVISHDGTLLMRANGADPRTLEALEKGVGRAIARARAERTRK